jgi:hypothetical protein
MTPSDQHEEWKVQDAIALISKILGCQLQRLPVRVERVLRSGGSRDVWIASRVHQVKGPQ